LSSWCTIKNGIELLNLFESNLWVAATQSKYDIWWNKTIANGSQKAHIVTLDIQPFMVDALHDLSLKYAINNNNSKLEDYSIQIWWYITSSLNHYEYPHTFFNYIQSSEIFCNKTLVDYNCISTAFVFLFLFILVNSFVIYCNVKFEK
jgi:hypothetical protein